LLLEGINQPGRKNIWNSGKKEGVDIRLRDSSRKKESRQTIWRRKNGSGRAREESQKKLN